MGAQWFKDLWSAEGRISRQRFSWNAFGVLASFILLFVFLETMVSRSATWALYPPLFWSAFALAARRLHDGGRSAWWLSTALIPIVGPLWLTFVLFLRPGSAGENPYGPDSAPEPLDYLAVDIHRPGPGAP